MNMRHRGILVAAVVLALGLWAASDRVGESPEQARWAGPAPDPGVAAAPLGLVRPAGFTDAGRELRLPKTAVDTGDIPHVVLSPDAAEDAPLPYYRIAPDTYMLFGNIAEVDARNRGWNGNAGFVVTPEGVLVIDALGTPKLGKRLIATIREVTDRPIRCLIVTHNHPDHSYGAVAFRDLAGVTVIAHEGTLEYLNSDGMERSAEFRRGFIAADMEGFEGVQPDVLIGGEPLTLQHTVELGARRFAIYNAGRHHSYGDLVVHQVEDGIVWISDLAFNQRTTFMGDGSSAESLAAQDWLLERFSGARLMVPGHGSAQTPPFPMVHATRDYVQRLREEMAAAVEAGVGLQDAVAHSDFPDWHGTRLYEENHPKNANFVYQEMELELF